MLSAGADRLLCYWDLVHGKKLWQKRTSSTVDTVALTPDGRFAAWGVDYYGGEVMIWDLRQDVLVNRLSGRELGASCLGASCLAITADLSQVLTAGGSYQRVNTSLRLWDGRTGDCLQSWPAHSPFTKGLAVTPLGDKAISSGADDAIRKARGAGRWPKALVSSVLVGIQNGVWKSPDANWVRGGLVQRRFCQECGFRISETPSKAPCPECKSVWVDRVFSAVSCPSCEAMAEDWFKYCPGCGRQRY